MTKRIAGVAVLVALVVTGMMQALAKDAKEVKDYSDTIAEFKKITGVAILRERARLRRLPYVGKGGLGIGGSHGRSQVYRDGKVIGFTSTSDISIGLQAGGQAYSQIIFFQNPHALEKFTSGNFEFAASA